MVELKYLRRNSRAYEMAVYRPKKIEIIFCIQVTIATNKAKMAFGILNLTLTKAMITIWDRMQDAEFMTENLLT